MTFKPLDTLRVIRDDDVLTSSEKTLLVFAVLRADNTTRRVKASLRLLATDAGVGYRTARRAFEPGNGRVLRYFSQVERAPRRVDLTFNSSVGTGSTERDQGSEAATVTGEAATVAHSCGHSGPPSALSATSSATTRYTAEWIEANAPSFDAETIEQEAKPGLVFHVEDHERPVSRAPEWKQRQLWEQSLARDEGLSERGEPLGRSR